MERQDLTAMLVLYRENRLEKKTLIEKISLFVYKFPLRVYKWSEDECSDFFSYFFPKIEKMIDTFEVRDIPFEVYLIKTLRLQIKTFAAKKTSDALSMRILANREFWPYDKIINSIACCEGNPSYSSDNGGTVSLFLGKILSGQAQGISRDSTLRKRILMLTLKNINSVGGDELSAIAALLGLEKQWLTDASDILREKMENKIGRKRMLEERRNRYFSRLCLLHELYCIYCSADEREKLNADIARVKTCIDKVTLKIDMLQIEPTHQDIADVMKIPKGSVDSGLFYLKLYLENS